MSNRSNGARSGWTRRENVKEYPLKVQCHVQWPTYHSVLDFRTKSKADAKTLTQALINQLVEPSWIKLSVKDEGVTIIQAKVWGEHIAHGLEEAFA